MTKMSILDKINVMIEVSKTSKLFIVVLIFLVFLAYTFSTTNKKNAKTGKKIYLIVYAFILLFMIIAYNSSLAKMFDYMMNNLFIVVFFPNLAIYLAAIITTNIILWISVFRFKTASIIKNINITVYCIMNYLLALILSIISSEKLDVFSQKSIYSNKNIQALIELSSTLFIVWVIFLIIYKIIMNYQHKDEELLTDPVIIEKKCRILPKNISEVKIPRYAKAVPKVQVIPKEPLKQNHGLDDLLTLEDYKLLLTILKEQKEKERLERERQSRIEAEQTKFRELQELYRNIK